MQRWDAEAASCHWRPVARDSEQKPDCFFLVWNNAPATSSELATIRWLNAWLNGLIPADCQSTVVDTEQVDHPRRC